MLDKFTMDQIGDKYINVTKYDYNMQADTVKMAIKKLTDTLEKNTCTISNVNSQNWNAKKCPI